MSYNLKIREAIVDFPHPLWPTIATFLLGEIVKLMLFKTGPGLEG